MATIRVDVAIGMHELAACWRERGTGEPRAREWHGVLPDGPTREAVERAFIELREMLGDHRRVVASVAILPPLARIRRIELPPMRNEDRRRAVSRSAERYFVGLGDSVLCATEPLGGATRSKAPFLAAAASAGLIGDLSAVMTEAGWTIDRVVPAHSAWLTMALARWPNLRRGGSSVVVEGDTETTVLQLEGGSLQSVRRVRPCDVVRTETDGEAQTLRRQVIREEGDEPKPVMLAARHAGRARRLELVPEAEREVRAVRESRLVRWLLVSSAACVVAATGAYRWSLSQQLSAVARERAEFRASVGRAMAARDSLAELARGTSAIAGLDASAPRWSAVLSRIAVGLPTDALVDVFKGDADSVTMQGQATNAAGVFGALRAARGVTSVRSNAPIRQELVAGHEATERWVLTLRVAHSDAARDRE